VHSPCTPVVHWWVVLFSDSIWPCGCLHASYYLICSAVLGSNVALAPCWQMDPGKSPSSVLGVVDSSVSNLAVHRSSSMSSVSVTPTRFHRFKSSTSSRFMPHRLSGLRSHACGRSLQVVVFDLSLWFLVLNRWWWCCWWTSTWLSSLEFSRWIPFLHAAYGIVPSDASRRRSHALDARSCHRSSV